MKRIVKSLLLAAIISMFVGSVSAFAATCYWVGDANPDWQISGNWASGSGLDPNTNPCSAVGGLPDSDDTAIFDDNTSVAINSISQPVNVDELRLEGTTYQNNDLNFSVSNQTLTANTLVVSNQYSQITMGSAALDVGSTTISDGEIAMGSSASNDLGLLNMSSSGAINGGSGTVGMSGASQITGGVFDAQTADINSVSNLTINGSGAEFYGGTGTITISGQLNIPDGRFDGESSTTNLGNVLNVSGGLFKASTGTTTVNLKMTISNDGEFEATSGSTLVFTNAVELQSGLLDLTDAAAVDVQGADGLDLSAGDFSMPDTPGVNVRIAYGFEVANGFVSSTTQTPSSDFLHNDGALEFYGSQFGTIQDYANDVINDVIINKTGNTISVEGSDLQILGDMDIQSGTLSSGGGFSRDITIGGSWTMGASGDFVEGDARVIFDADTSNPSINGSTTFYDLVFIEPDGQITLEAGETQTVSNEATLNGATGQLLTIKSSSTSPAFIVPTNEDIDYVDIQYVDNTRGAGLGGDIDLSSTAKGHTENTESLNANSGWIFDNPYVPPPSVPEFSKWLLLLTVALGLGVLYKKDLLLVKVRK